MKKHIIFIITIIVIFSAQDCFTFTNPEKWSRNHLTTFPARTHFSANSYSVQYSDDGEPKSYAVAIILSAIMPGAGEVYLGSPVKGAVFAGIDVISWISYTKLNNQGDDIKVEFRAFADEHWSRTLHKIWVEEWRATHGGQDPPGSTHTLPESNTQQYYEMIGKYDQFLHGWDDYDSQIDQSQRRLDYEWRRNDSNVKYKRALYFAMIAMTNRVISLIDTIWGVKKHNENAGYTCRWYFTSEKYAGEVVPTFNLKMRW